MTQMNPITGAALGTAAAERAATADKAAQMKRVVRNRKNTPTGDTFERAIESPDELEPVSDQHHKQQPKQNHPRKKQTHDEEPPRLDIRA